MKYSQTFVFLFILGYVTNIADLLVICQLVVSQQGYSGSSSSQLLENECWSYRFTNIHVSLVHDQQ